LNAAVRRGLEEDNELTFKSMYDDKLKRELRRRERELKAHEDVAKRVMKEYTKINDI
jgi:hypothetical protein